MWMLLPFVFSADLGVDRSAALWQCPAGSKVKIIFVHAPFSGGRSFFRTLRVLENVDIGVSHGTALDHAYKFGCSFEKNHTKPYCFSDDFRYDTDTNVCRLWAFVSREPVGRVAACWHPRASFKAPKLAFGSDQKTMGLMKKKKHKECYFCSGVTGGSPLAKSCWNVSMTAEDYVNWPREEDKEGVRNSAVWMIAPDSGIQKSSGKYGPVTNNPDHALEQAKRRLDQYAAVIPVEHLFDGYKLMNYLMNMPLPGSIANVRTMHTTCGLYNEFTKDMEEVGVDAVDCTNRNYACYFAKNKIRLKSGELVESGHSPEVVRYIRDKNALDHELHLHAIKLWEEKWVVVSKTLGPPRCTITCDSSLTQQSCDTERLKTETNLQTTYLTDDFRSSVKPLLLECTIDTSQCW